MATVDDLDGVIERCQQALREFVKGNPKPMQTMFSHREDVTLANPIAPPARGWDEVAQTMERAASNLREGEIDAFESVARRDTPELAYVVWIERTRGKIGQRDEIVSFPLRVTMIFRPEDDTWKIVHRHADTVTAARPPESMIQE
ncbi:MAG TPA: nuclear transport factor 2 family protein [Rubrobacter sp.]|nr:nuclear transport factor 2 family protein [Rubrobacter sp.]